MRRLSVISVQVGIVVVVLLLWEFVPRISGASSLAKLFDPYFISSPTDVASRISDLATGHNDAPLIWPYLERTALAAIVGTVVGMCVGGVVGLVLSASDTLDRVFRPFLVALNAVPRIALIPIIITLVGISFTASATAVMMVAFFVALYNAYEGARSVERHLVQYATVMGASRWQVVRRVRAPYALAWTLASLPLAVAFGFVAAVTLEILTGYPGMGQILSIATQTGSASTTFATVIYLSVIGVVLTALAEAVKHRVLHWWAK
jgi:NitT/TauT family transport system permease protein